MTGMLYYPLADKTTQRFDDDYAGVKWTPPAEKGCVHTTETTGWPGYSGGATAPNMTAKPDFVNKKLLWRQHFPLNMSARALQNDSGGVETNRDKIIQLEIVGTCDGTSGGAHARWTREGIPHLYTPEAPDWVLEQLADFFVFCYEEHGVALAAPSLWLPYDDSYGNSDARMSGSQFNAFRGWMGHMHVAENDHGDPGKMDVPKVITIAKNKMSASSIKGDADMYIAWHSNVPYLISPIGKRKLSIEAKDEIKSKAAATGYRIPDMGAVSSTLLGEFPTFDENGSVGGTTYNSITTTSETVAELMSNTLPALAGQVEELARVVGEVNSKVDELLAEDV